MARVVVVGGGFGGLASALRLAKLGHRVSLVEERELGGALVPLRRDGFTWDHATHTLLPAVVRDLFRKTGRPLERELELEQLDCLREHWFADGTSLVHQTGRTAQHDAFETLGSGLGARWVEHVGDHADDWDVIRRRYAEVAWDPHDVPPDLAERFDSRETLYRRLRRLPDERLRLVAAHSFLTDGHDVRDVPAWAGLTSYLEQRLGAWAFVGGTEALLAALLRRLETRHVDVVPGRARDIVLRGGRAVAVATTTAGDLDADVVVCAVDPRRLPALAELVRRTSPAVPPPMTYVGLHGPVPELPHELVVHGDQTLVVRTTGRAPDDGAAWSIRALGNPAEDALRVLARHGLDLREQVATRADLTPRDLVERWGGTPLGVAWAGRRTVRRRLGPRTPLPGVFVAGAHAAPGSGLPWVGLSAALVAQVVGPAS